MNKDAVYATMDLWRRPKKDARLNQGEVGNTCTSIWNIFLQRQFIFVIQILAN